MTTEGIEVCTTAVMVSFELVVALSEFSNNLNQTLASWERVLAILEEEPLVEEIPKPARSLLKASKEEPLVEEIPETASDYSGSDQTASRAAAVNLR